MPTQKDKERSVVEQDKHLLSRQGSVSASTLNGDNWKDTTSYARSSDYAYTEKKNELANSPQSLKSELRVFLKDFILTDDIPNKKREWL